MVDEKFIARHLYQHYVSQKSFGNIAKPPTPKASSPSESTPFLPAPAPADPSMVRASNVLFCTFTSQTFGDNLNIFFQPIQPLSPTDQLKLRRKRLVHYKSNAARNNNRSDPDSPHNQVSEIPTRCMVRKISSRLRDVKKRCSRNLSEP